jgi:hypothetical protein
LNYNVSRRNLKLCYEYTKIVPFQVQAAIKGSAAGKTVASEGVEESIIYVRFKAAASEVPACQYSGLTTSYNCENSYGLLYSFYVSIWRKGSLLPLF